MNSGDRIIATDMQDSAPALQAADVKLTVPAVYADNYISELLGICKKYAVDAIISLNDLELPILAREKSRFEENGTRVIISSTEVIDICFDKNKTMQWLESIGLTTPRTYISLDGVREALRKGEIKFPLLMKPRWGSSSIGLEVVEDEEEMEMCYNLLRKKIKKTILAKASIGDEYVVIQEIVTGDEYNLDIMNDLEGRNMAVCAKKKLSIRAGETDKATIVGDRLLNDVGREIGQRLGHIGNLDVDLIVADGKCYIIDLNPRFGGGFPFTYEAGINYPLALLKMLRGDCSDFGFNVKVGTSFAKTDYIVEIK